MSIVSRQRVSRSHLSRAVAVVAVLAALLFVQSAGAGAATSRLHNAQAVLSAFDRSGITLHVVIIRSRTRPRLLRGVTFIGMLRAEAVRFGFDVTAWIFRTVAAAKSERGLLGDVHGADGGFARLVDNVLVQVAPWSTSGIGGVLRDMPSSVESAILRLQSGASG